MENQELVELVGTVMKREIAPINVRLDSLENHLGSFEKTTNNHFNLIDRHFGKMDYHLDLIENSVEILAIKEDITLHKIDKLEHKIDDLTCFVDEMGRNLGKELRLLLDGQERIIAALKEEDTLVRLKN